MSEAVKSIVEYLGIILAIAIASALKNYKEKREAKKVKEAEEESSRKAIENKPIQVRNQLKIDDIIENIYLVELRVKLNASRIHILMYHNGTTSFGGTSFLFFSMLYESVDIGYTPAKPSYQKIPCGEYTKEILQVDEEGTIYIGSNDPSKLGTVHRMFGIESAYKIRIADSIVNGTITIAFKDSRKLTKEELKIVEEYNVKIKTLLDVRDK